MFPNEDIPLHKDVKKAHNLQMRDNNKRIVEEKDIEDDDLDVETLISLQYNQSVEQNTSFNVARRNTGPKQQDDQRSQELLSTALYLYHRAIAIASDRKNRNKLSIEQVESFEKILSSQRQTINDELKKIVSNEDSIDVQGDNRYSFIILQEPLTLHQRQKLDSKMLKQQMKVTKQIIILLDLALEDFNIRNGTSLPENIMTYLFESVKEKTAIYLHSVNVMYQVRSAYLKLFQKNPVVVFKYIYYSNRFYNCFCLFSEHENSPKY